MRSVFLLWANTEYDCSSLLKVFSTAEAARALHTKLVEHLKEKPVEFDWTVEPETDAERDVRWKAFVELLEAWSSRCPLAEHNVRWTDSYQIQELEVEEGTP